MYRSSRNTKIYCLVWPGNWSVKEPILEREAAEPFYFRLLLNLASGLISSLANCRPFFSPFPHIPPWGGFCKVSIVRIKSSWRSPSTKRLFAQNSGPDRSEMEVRAFASIKKVTWDKLLASNNRESEWQLQHFLWCLNEMKTIGTSSLARSCLSRMVIFFSQLFSNVFGPYLRKQRSELRSLCMCLKFSRSTIPIITDSFKSRV